MMVNKFLPPLLLLLIIGSPLNSQMLSDNFEDDLSNWRILEGFAEIQGANEFNFANAVRLFRPNLPSGAQTTMIHKTFQDNFGIYEVACYADGPLSDVQFLFQYIDDQNYYKLSCNPRDTDNPLLMLWKIVDGDYTLLDSIGPVVDLNRWFILRVERYCDGSIDIYIDDDLKIEVTDRSLLQPGTIGLAAWAASTYFDALTFQSKNADIVVDLDEYICSGRFYELADNRYNESGFYADTLQTAQGCDSIIRLQLTIVPHYLVTDRDTICSHEFRVFGGDTLRTSGRYNDAFQSIHGCDSLVELNLIALGGDTISSDSTLCDGQFIVFNSDTIFESGSYYDSVFADDGCFGIFQLNVNTVDALIDLGDDRSVCFEDTPFIPLRATGFDSVAWFDGRNQETIAISTAGIYWVEVFLSNCSASDTVEISEFCEPKTEVYIPNAFSPNSDQLNDTFTVSVIKRPSTFLMRIFNRWGSQLFESEDQDIGWDGTLQGKAEPPGVYVYVIEMDGTQFSGTVTLIR